MKEKIALLFPGQGAQSVGMDEDVADSEEAKEIYEEASDIIDSDIGRIIKEGPKEKLARTKHAQPAVFLDSYIRFQILKKKLEEIDCLVGHSLGEFSALVAGGSLTFKEGLKLVSRRGRSMEKANKDGSMIAVLGLTSEEIQGILKEIENPPVIANHNSPRQIVLSGSREQLKKAKESINTKGKIIDLEVSGPFHSPYMEEAENQLAKTIKELKFEDPRFPVFSAVSAQMETDGRRLKDLLLEQMTSPVPWVKGVNRILERGVKIGVEMGSSDVLCKLIDRTAPDIETYTFKEVHQSET